MTTTVSTVPTVADLADRYRAASAHDDADGLAAVFAPSVVLWHGFDAAPREVPGAGLAKVVAAEARAARNRLTGYRRTEEALHVAGQAFVSTRTVRGTAPDGTEVALSQCTVCHVADGAVVRVDTYYDRAQAAALVALVAPPAARPA